MATRQPLIVIPPVEITDAILTSSTVPETDYAAWSAGTTYALGNRVIRTTTHKVYESLAGSNVGNTPETSPTKWIEVSSTNRWKAFDHKSSSKTVQAGSIGYVLAPGRVCNGFAALGLVGTSIELAMFDTLSLNKLRYSERLDHSGWTVTNATIVADATAAPDGTTTADKIKEDSTAGVAHYAMQAITKAASAITYVASAYVKPGGRNWVQLAVYDGASVGHRVWFNVSTGAVGTTSAIGAGFTSVSAGITADANGFYRCWVKFTTNTATALQFFVYTASADATTSHNGDGTSGVYAWGTQIEQASTLGTYYRTPVYYALASLLGSITEGSWYSYFFDDSVETRDMVVMLDIPPYGSGSFEVTITAATGNAECGSIVLGYQKSFGVGVDLGAQIGILDYSRKETSDFGDQVLIERAYSDRAEFSMMIENGEIRPFVSAMKAYRATPILWIGHPEYASTIVLGFYKDFDVTIAYQIFSEASLTIEGLT